MAKKLHFDLHTAIAFLIWAALLTWGYHENNPQYGNYATWMTIGFSGYAGKRLWQKRKEFNAK